MHILVTGANGQLGHALQQWAKQKLDYEWTFLNRSQLPIDDASLVQQWFDQNKIDYCINAAAYTAVDKAESEPDSAESINAIGVKNLAEACLKQHARLVHISTDYVFDGSKPTGYSTDDLTGPMGVYGKTKLEGEKFCLDTDANHIVIRTSWVFGSHGNNFVKTMIRLMKEREEIGVVNDQIGRPTFVNDLAEAIVRCIEKGEALVGGIYHFANSGAISWFNFAEAIRDKMMLNCKVNAIPSSAYPTPAKRPAFSILLTDKLEHAIEWTIPTWEDGLVRCLDELKN